MKNKFIFGGAIVGFTVPGIFWSIYILSNYRYIFGTETILLWPSSIFLMATDGTEQTVGAYMGAIASVLINILLYTIIAIALYGMVRIINKLRNGA